MVYSKFLFLILILSTSLFGQEIGEWNNYTDMKDVTEIASYSDGFWMSSTGGAGHYYNDYDNYITFLTKSEGLNNQNLTTLSLDENSNVWFGMINGVINIYNPKDGSMQEILDINQSNYTKKSINDFFISGDTNFVSTEFGLALIHTEFYAFIETVTKLGDFTSAEIVNSTNVFNNKIYVSTKSGVAIQKDGANNLIAPESWTSYNCGSDIPAGETYSTVYYDDRIIASTNVGLVQFDGTNWSHYAYNTKINDMMVKDDLLYILTDNSLNSFDGSNDYQIFTSNSEIFYKFDLSENKVLIGTDLGVIEVGIDSSRSIISNGPINNSFQSLAVDKNSALWVGTGKDVFGEGFMKFEDGIWTNFNTFSFPELPNNNYHRVSADNYQVYLSNWGAGLTLEEDGSFSYLNSNNSELVGIPSDPKYIVIQNAARDSKNDLWIFNFASADEKPIIQLTQDSVWYHYMFPFFQINEEIYLTDGMIDQYNTKWFSIIGRGLFYFNENGTPENTEDDVWGWLRESDGLNSSDITSLALDERGELWVGTPNGANIITNPSSPKSRISNAYAILEQSVTSIAVDPLNNKWVGTYQGLFVLTPDGNRLIEQYGSENSSLPTNEIRTVAIDKNSGIIYIGTSFGLSTLTTPSIEANQSFDELYVYPNPFIIREGANLSIDGLMSNSAIKVLTISGDVVRELETPGGRLGFWDGKNKDGNYVASGIYIIVASDEEASSVSTAKVAIIKN